MNGGTAKATARGEARRGGPQEFEKTPGAPHIPARKTSEGTPRPPVLHRLLSCEEVASRAGAVAEFTLVWDIQRNTIELNGLEAKLSSLVTKDFGSLKIAVTATFLESEKTSYFSR